MGIGAEITSLIQEQGQSVVLVDEVGEARTCKAILQYVKGTSSVEGVEPLGVRDLRKLLYLGEAGFGMEAGGTRVQWQGMEYEVISVHPVYFGTTLAYWRGVLQEAMMSGF